MANPSRAMRAPKADIVCAAHSRMNPACAHSAPDGRNFRTGNLQKNEFAARAYADACEFQPVFTNEDRELGEDSALHGTTIPPETNRPWREFDLYGMFP